MGLFLVTGSIGPFGSIYTWLITNVPGFWIFRDPSKFTPILILGYMGMLCYGLEFIGNHLPKRLLQIELVFYLSVLPFRLYWAKLLVHLVIIHYPKASLLFPINLNNYQDLQEFYGYPKTPSWSYWTN